MIYAVSDLHGCYEKYLSMLEKIQFRETDTLYILGDVVDRGDGGIKILLDMIKRKNVIPLRGNHDYLAYCLLKNLSRPLQKQDTNKTKKLYQSWFCDGGYPTYTAFIKLPLEKQKMLLAYLNTFLLYDEVKAGCRSFFLSHTVPEKERMLHFDTLRWQELIVGEPEYEKEYFPDRYLVTGHTPTGLIDESCSGRIYQKNNHIAIDCGAVFGNPLGCICLNTFEEFYTL